MFVFGSETMRVKLKFVIIMILKMLDKRLIYKNSHLTIMCFLFESLIISDILN